MNYHSYPLTSSPLQCRRNQRGVALIIVLGFLGLMVMMAVAFMVQARVERMVADTTLEGMRARQIAQTGIAGALQDYLNASIDALKARKQPPELFLSGDGRVTQDSFHYSKLTVDSTNLWNGEAIDWLPANFKSSDARIDLDDVQDMEWIWVREKPGSRSRILGRYAYACFNLSGGVDANLLGRDYDGQTLPAKGYGASTNRNNVRKMFLNSIPTKPSSLPSSSTDRQSKLTQYQDMWKGFDTPVALSKLTDGVFNDGEETGGPNSSKPNRWAMLDMDERDVGKIQTDYLSCYSYSTTYEGVDETKKILLSRENLSSIQARNSFKKLVAASKGNETDVGKALEDYFNPSLTPQGTGYPSVKAVPMFNEIMVQVELKTSDGKIHVTLKPEFYCPFPQQDKLDHCTLKPLQTMAGGMAQSGSADIWLYGRVITAEGPASEATFSADPATPTQLSVDTPKDCSKPWSPGEFEYILNIDLHKEDESTPEIRGLQLRGITIQKPWELLSGSTKAVDATPENLSFVFNAVIGPDKPVAKSLEVEDPRLNHLAAHWNAPEGASDSMNDPNTCLAAARNRAKKEVGYDPGQYMYCRNGNMQSPVELGYIPVYDGNTPWMTLDVFSDSGIDLMNTLVCNTSAWERIQQNHVFFTNGTINPYTRDTPVIKGAFCGIDVREVPDMAGDEILISDQTSSEIADEFVKDKDPDGKPFTKDGPAGWMRVLRYKGFDFNKKDANSLANKNERLALAHNTWGLFNESDSLFLVFVIAQSISEAPDKVQAEGTWDEDEDMITGERRAVALCWMDTNTDESTDDKKREMDIIMFKYLNE